MARLSMSDKERKYKELGANIKGYLALHGMNNKQGGEAMGRTLPTFLDRLRHPEEFQYHELVNLASRFNVSVAELIAPRWSKREREDPK